MLRRPFLLERKEQHSPTLLLQEGIQGLRDRTFPFDRIYPEVPMTHRDAQDRPRDLHLRKETSWQPAGRIHTRHQECGVCTNGYLWGFPPASRVKRLFNPDQRSGIADRNTLAEGQCDPGKVLRIRILQWTNTDGVERAGFAQEVREQRYSCIECEPPVHAREQGLPVGAPIIMKQPPSP